MIDELNCYSRDVQGDQMEDCGGVTGSFIDEIHSWDIQRDQMEGESMALLEESFMSYILRISKEMKWKVKVVLLEVSLMNFFFGYPTISNGK